MTREHVREELGAYALGALDDREAASVRSHLERCPRCAADLAEVEDLPALLDLAAIAGPAAGEGALSPALEERVLDSFARERPRPARPRRVLHRRRALTLAGAMAVAAVVAALAVAGTRDPRPPYRLALAPTRAAPGARGGAGLQAVPGGTLVRLDVADLPGGPDAVYEVRCDGPRWSASAGTFRVGRDGRATVTLTTAARRGEYDRIRVVRRMRDGHGRVRTADVLDARLG